MRRVVVLALGCIVLNRLLLAAVGGTGSFTAPTSAYFGLINGQSGDGEYKIGAVTRAVDGTWSEYASNPVLTKGAAGQWDDAGVKDPWLMYVGGQYVMYYSGYDGSNIRTGRATAPSHEGPWTKYAGNPVLDLGSGGSWDDFNASFVTVLYEPTDTGREWKMWYTGDDGAVGKIGYAYSSDGLSWTKYASNPVVTVGSSGAWDDEGVSLGCVNKIGSTYYMQLAGRQGTTNPQWQGGLVTFTDPEGTYTKHASNPFLLARHNTASISQQPTGDIAMGATTVGLPTPGLFNVGEPFALVDGATVAPTMIGYVTAVGGSTVTLDRATTAAYQASGGVFRPFAFNSVVLRTVIRLGDGTLLGLGTPFQPVEGLTIPESSHLWEGSFEWTAPDLTTNWSYRYVAGRGLLFPLQIGASWHTRSAENPSVIAAP